MASSLSRTAALLGTSLWLSTSIGAAGLSRRLTENEVRTAANILAFGSAHRAWTAPAIPNENLGLEVGIETDFLFRRSLLEQGDGTAIMPRIIPVPRFWGMWDLPREFQVSASWAPGFLFDGITALGAAGQLAFFQDEDLQATASLLLDYTYANAFGDLKSNTFELAAQISRDLDVWQPYAAMGFMVTGARVRSGLAMPGNDSSVARSAFHFYAGARIDLMAKLGFQIDLYNFMPAFSAKMSTTF